MPETWLNLFSRNADIVERADGDEDERDSDDLNDAVGHHGAEADAKIDVGDVEESEGRKREADGNDDARVELGGQDSGDRAS